MPCPHPSTTAAETELRAHIFAASLRLGPDDPRPLHLPHMRTTVARACPRSRMLHPGTFIDDADEDLVNVWLDRYNRISRRGAIDAEAAAVFFAEMEQWRRYQIALTAEQAEISRP